MAKKPKDPLGDSTQDSYIEIPGELQRRAEVLKQRKDMVKDIAKIKEAIVDRKGMRTPKARAERRQTLSDKGKEERLEEIKSKSFIRLLGKEMVSSTLESTKSIISMIPGADMIGRALQERKKQRENFDKAEKKHFEEMVEQSHERAKSEAERRKAIEDQLDADERKRKEDEERGKGDYAILDDKGDGNGVDGSGADDITDAILTIGSGSPPYMATMVDLLEVIKEKMSFIADQTPTKLEQREEKNEKRALRRRNEARARQAGAAGGGGGGGGEGDEEGWGIMDTILAGLMGKEVLGMAGRGVKNRWKKMGGGTSRLGGRRGRMLKSALAVLGIGGGGAAAATMLGPPTPAGLGKQGTKMKQLQTSLKSIRTALATARAVRLATAPLRVAAAGLSLGLSELAFAAADLGATWYIDKTLTDAYGSAYATGRTHKKFKAKDEETGKEYTKLVHADTGMVISDWAKDRLNVNGTSPQTKTQERKNIKRNMMKNDLAVNEAMVLRAIGHAAAAHENDEDQEANMHLHAAKDTLADRARIIGKGGITDRQEIEKLLRLSVKGQKQFDDLIPEVKKNVWAAETIDMDHIEDLEDQFNAIHRPWREIHDPSDIEGFNQLSQTARNIARKEQPIRDAQDEADRLLVESYRKNPGLLLDPTERALAVDRLGEAAIKELEQLIPTVSAGGIPTDLAAASELAKNASSASAATNQNANTLNQVANTVSTNSTISSNTTNVTAQGDSRNNEGAYRQRQNKDSRGEMFGG